MPRINYFDISADDPRRVIRFYESVFGWRVERWDGPFEYWRIRTGSPDEPGIDGGLAKRTEFWQSVTPIIDVPDLDEFVRRIETEGGTIVEPRTTIPGVGYLASFKDTEGNVLAVLQADPSAG